MDKDTQAQGTQQTDVTAQGAHGTQTDGDEKPQAVPYERFAEVNKKARELEARLAEIEEERKKQQEKELAEQNKWRELAEQREKELEAERVARLRLQIATKTGLPVDMADRLRGKTAEEMEQDAQSLLQYIAKPQQSPGTPPASGGNNKPLSIETMTPEQIRQHAADLLKM